MDTGELQDLIERTPASRFFGFRLVSRSDEEAELALEARSEFVQEAGVIHGGVLASLADSTAVYSLLPHVPTGCSLTSVEFKLNFLRPALRGEGEIRAHARLVQRGRTVALCDVEVSQGARLVAKGLFTYLFPPRERPETETRL